MNAVATKQPTTAGKLTIRDHLQSADFIAEISKVLPRHMSAERMARVAMTALTRTPMLSDCTQQSFFRCMLDLSQWGLEPDGRRAHLIPFRDNKKGTVECTLIIDYKGLVELAYRSGVVQNIHADVVRKGDIFRYNLGVVSEHCPWAFRVDENRPAEVGDIIAAYCIVSLKGDLTKCEVMTKQEIESIRTRSKAGNSGPWVTDWAEMAKKTVFRRVTKWLPLSAEIVDAFDGDDDRMTTLESSRIVDTTQPKITRTASLEDRLTNLLSDQSTPDAEVIDPTKPTE